MSYRGPETQGSYYGGGGGGATAPEYEDYEEEEDDDDEVMVVDDSNTREQPSGSAEEVKAKILRQMSDDMYEAFRSMLRALPFTAVTDGVRVLEYADHKPEPSDAVKKVASAPLILSQHLPCLRWACRRYRRAVMEAMAAAPSMGGAGAGGEEEEEEAKEGEFLQSLSSLLSLMEAVVLRERDDLAGLEVVCWARQWQEGTVSVVNNYDAMGRREDYPDKYRWLRAWDLMMRGYLDKAAQVLQDVSSSSSSSSSPFTFPSDSFKSSLLSHLCSCPFLPFLYAIDEEEQAAAAGAGEGRAARAAREVMGGRWQGWRREGRALLSQLTSSQLQEWKGVAWTLKLLCGVNVPETVRSIVKLITQSCQRHHDLMDRPSGGDVEVLLLAMEWTYRLLTSILYAHDRAPNVRVRDLKSLPRECWEECFASKAVSSRAEREDLSRAVTLAEPRLYLLSSVLAEDYHTDYGGVVSFYLLFVKECGLPLPHRVALVYTLHLLATAAAAAGSPPRANSPDFAHLAPLLAQYTRTVLRQEVLHLLVSSSKGSTTQNDDDMRTSSSPPSPPLPGGWRLTLSLVLSLLPQGPYTEPPSQSLLPSSTADYDEDATATTSMQQQQGQEGGQLPGAWDLLSSYLRVEVDVLSCLSASERSWVERLAHKANRRNDWDAATCRAGKDAWCRAWESLRIEAKKGAAKVDERQAEEEAIRRATDMTSSNNNNTSATMLLTNGEGGGGGGGDGGAAAKELLGQAVVLLLKSREGKSFLSMSVDGLVGAYLHTMADTLDPLHYYKTGQVPGGIAPWEQDAVSFIIDTVAQEVNPHTKVFPDPQSPVLAHCPELSLLYTCHCAKRQATKAIASMVFGGDDGGDEEGDEEEEQQRRRQHLVEEGEEPYRQALCSLVDSLGSTPTTTTSGVAVAPKRFWPGIVRAAAAMLEYLIRDMDHSSSSSSRKESAVVVAEPPPRALLTPPLDPTQASRLLTALYEVDLSHRRHDYLLASPHHHQPGASSVDSNDGGVWGRRLRMTLTTALGQALVAQRYDDVYGGARGAAADQQQKKKTNGTRSVLGVRMVGARSRHQGGGE